ncbi:hypothetical protein GALL_551820 [mine drainage metagenome]|uniref:Uncharacterized protein n=1 Tax=mine drainage metagenome TaxID=410659 RepID=A0A1J5PI89_9ZZZZ
MWKREQRSLHRVWHQRRIVGDKHIARALGHVGRIAIAVAEIQSPGAGKTRVPRHDGGVERRHRLHCQHHGPRRRHRIGRRRIAAHFGAIKHHAVEILEERVIGQSVEKPVNRHVAIPSVAVRDDAQMRPALRLGDGMAQRHLPLAAFTNIGHRLEGHQQSRGVVDEKGRMFGAQRLEIAQLFADIFDTLEPLCLSCGVTRVGVKRILHCLGLFTRSNWRSIPIL